MILNFTANPPVFALPADIAYSGKDLMIANYEVDPAEDIALLTLRPYRGAGLSADLTTASAHVPGPDPHCTSW